MTDDHLADFVAERQARLRAEHQLDDAMVLIAALRLKRPGVGEPQQTLLNRLVTAWADLEHLGDPRRGRSYEAPPGTSAGSESDEGSSTRRYRKIKAELNRRVRSAIDEAYDRIDGTWEPPPRCGSCGRRQRRSARRCDRCGTPLGQDTPSTAQAPQTGPGAPQITLEPQRDPPNRVEARSLEVPRIESGSTYPGGCILGSPRP